MINTLGEEISQLPEETTARCKEEWKLLVTAFTEVCSVLGKDPDLAAILFSEYIPIPFGAVDAELCRKASFLTHVAYVYEQSPVSARENVIEWLIRNNFGQDWETGEEIGIQGVYKQFISGDFDF